MGRRRTSGKVGEERCEIKGGDSMRDKRSLQLIESNGRAALGENGVGKAQKGRGKTIG